jgi:hypothetical protein
MTRSCVLMDDCSSGRHTLVWLLGLSRKALSAAFMRVLGWLRALFCVIVIRRCWCHRVCVNSWRPTSWRGVFWTWSGRWTWPRSMACIGLTGTGERRSIQRPACRALSWQKDAVCCCRPACRLGPGLVADWLLVCLSALVGLTDARCVVRHRPGSAA